MPVPARGSTDTGVTPLACDNPPHSDKDPATGHFLDVSGVNIRRGPHLWTYVVDTTSNPDVAGWVSDVYMDMNSHVSRDSLVPC